MTFLQKHWKISQVYIARILAYKMRVLIWTLSDAVYVFVMPLVWLAAFGGKNNIAGFDRSGLVTYYIILGIVFILATPHPEEDMGKCIKDGQVSKYLIRPFTWFRHYLASDGLYRFVQIAALAPIIVLAVFFYREYFIFTNGFNLLLMILAGAIAYFAFFQLSFSVGCAGFWLDEARAVNNVYWFFLIVFGGAMAPIEFMPIIIQKVAAFLPFQYFHYFPVKLYLGQLTYLEVIQGFIVLGFWLAAGFLIYRTIWHFGTKRYSAVGG